MFKADQKIVLVTRQTRLQGLKAKYATLGHAKFAVAGAMVKELAREAEVLGEEISIDRLRDSAERQFHEYMTARHPKIGDTIRTEKVLSKETEAELKSAISDFKGMFK